MPLFQGMPKLIFSFSPKAVSGGLCQDLGHNSDNEAYCTGQFIGSTFIQHTLGWTDALFCAGGIQVRFLNATCAWWLSAHLLLVGVPVVLSDDREWQSSTLRVGFIVVVFCTQFGKFFQPVRVAQYQSTTFSLKSLTHRIYQRIWDPG